MQSFEHLLEQFNRYFDQKHFPDHTPTLYEPAEYFLGLGGKRVRPVMLLMGNELFDQIHPDAWDAGVAVELFHNFTLIHDDIMDQAPLRRGKPTVHERYGASTALLAGDVVFVRGYEYLNKVNVQHLQRLLALFNVTARQVCEGQQLDMDFEKRSSVKLEEYIHMIELKTSVLLAASLQMGAILGGAGEGNQHHLFEFGKNLGIAFQIQDDYLDAFGDPSKFGKQVGGDIKANKKTFLLIKALEVASGEAQANLLTLLQSDPPEKVADMLALYRETGVDQWAMELKEHYYQEAMRHLDAIAVLSSRKSALRELSAFLIQREH
jgi:geranylgeranyl diphosphate synthase type II